MLKTRSHLYRLVSSIYHRLFPDNDDKRADLRRELGSEAAWLVHGSDGTDEITITGPTAVVALEDGAITSLEVHPEGFYAVYPRLGGDALTAKSSTGSPSFPCTTLTPR